MGEGSRDTSAQLFVALLRSFGIPARLIFSLQVVSFKMKSNNNNNDTSKGDYDNNNEEDNVRRMLGLGKYKLSSKYQSNNVRKRKGREDDDEYSPYSRVASGSRKSQRNSSCGY